MSNCSFFGFFVIVSASDVMEGYLEDYEEGLKACEEAPKIWMQVVKQIV